MPTESRTGVQLADAFNQEVVRPLLLGRWPALPYAAARLGSGSDVLGLDDAMSQDHDWGLRLNVFVPAEWCAPVAEALATDLPDMYEGHAVRFAFSGSERVKHRVEVAGPQLFVIERLGFDPCIEDSVEAWLSLTGQAVLEIVGGAVFEDGWGELTKFRNRLAWYPDDLWTYLVACGWRRLDQELPIMARAGDRGDDLGSRVIATRLVDVAMHLAFLLRRRWWPYSKWRGTVFSRLPGVDALAESLAKATTARAWTTRQDALKRAVSELVGMQSDAGLPTGTGQGTQPFWDRPYLHVDSSLLRALLGQITDPAIRSLPLGLGSIEQITSSVDVLVDPSARRAVIGSLDSR